EPRVAPSTINAKQWEWMKRYRVWEANRKVFLWPENWLEPELRDDQSPFFKETMSELLQSDITEDKAAMALLNYLAKLEEVAKLEPCGIHYVENDPGTADDITHVVARTAGGNRKYFYRRREYGYWTPWEQINLDIEDNPVIPVVWRGRLFLFWLKILKEPASDNLADVNPADVIPTEAPKVTVKAILCWSEHYNGKWQATKTSDISDPAWLDKLTNESFNRSTLWLSVSGTEAFVRINIVREDEGGTSFVLFNTHSLPQWGNIKLEKVPRILDTSGGTFFIDYVDIAVGDQTRPVLKTNVTDRALQAQHSLNDVSRAPFFYEDRHHVFSVTTDTQFVPIHAQPGYGIATSHDSAASKIPPLVVEEALHFPLKPEPDPFRNTTMDGTVPIQRFLTEDAHINKAIGTMGTVLYGNVTIGMSCSLNKT
ncbi:MAG: neuraminidase-like domain-containing protein, partial [Deltaproteobacteria bacterium]|nr:neuraminidase-like domain-containing protein [Deltaproteobacteria bacterium]